MKTLTILGTVLLAIASLSYAGQPIALVHAKIYPITSQAIDDGTILIMDGLISDVGKEVKVPLEARVIDVTGQRVLPGFIDGNCHAGLEEISEVEATVDDLEKTSPITPQMRVTDGFFPESKTIGVTRVNGVTACVISPSSTNVLSGFSSLVEFSEKQVSEAVILPDAGMNATLGEAPKAAYGSKNQMPQTRMGTAALLRATLQKAKEYGEKLEAYKKGTGKPDSGKGDNSGPPARDLQLEALQEVLSGKLPLVVSAHRADDILTAVRIAKEFGIVNNLVINHGTEAYKVKEILAQEHVPVVVGPVTTQPDTMETLGARYDNAAQLVKAGILVAIQTDESHNIRNLPYEAGIAVANGLSYEEALKAITLNPARIFHFDRKLGSIEKGKRADLIVAAGDPLEPRTEVTHVFIGGEELPDTSYHRRLWEEFQQSVAKKATP